jgi:bifunctional N-acetylglucosamine-1-phosphate-uridyltransferase/glucosamine-1-phosphate-acetyltransferase GlmU-like protein
VDPASCTLSEDCRFGRDVVVEPQTHFRGCCSIGDNSKLGPGSIDRQRKPGRSRRGRALGGARGKGGR